MSIAIALVRESSALMVGQYFKRRRDFVEIVVQMGAGIGVILFSVFFKEALGFVFFLFNNYLIVFITFLMRDKEKEKKFFCAKGGQLLG